MRGFRQWRWHLDEIYVKIGGEMHYLWRAVDHEGEVLESFATKTRDKAAALRFMKKAMKRYCKPEVVVTDGLRSCGAAMTERGNVEKQEVGRWLNNRVENLLRSRPSPQPLQPGTSSRRSPDLQAPPLSRTAEWQIVMS